MMLSHNSPRFLRRSILMGGIAVLFGLTCIPAPAATLLWDANNVTAGAQDGNGTWQAGLGNWRNTGTSTDNVTFTDGDTVTFGANTVTASTVTVSGTVATSSITFAANARYTLTGGTINLTGATPTITSSFGGGIVTSVPAASISSTLTGSAGLTWQALGSLTLSGANTYTGTTTFASLTGGGFVSTMKLNFSAAGAPAADILYNGVGTAGDVIFNNFAGTGGGGYVLVIQGAASGANSQRFGSVTVGSSASGTTPIAASISVLSGTGNTTSLTTGTLARNGLSKTLALTGPASGTITAMNANGLVGTWSTYASATGTLGGWAGVTGNTGSGGTVGVFTGDLAHATGTDIASLGGYSTTSNLTVASASTGNVSQAAGTTQLNTVSMTDTVSDRTVAVGAGNTLRLGEAGGVQLIAGAKNLTIGAAGNAGTLTAGNAGVTSPTASNDLMLTNMSGTSTLTVNSVIANNGVSATNDIVNLVINGTGLVVLTGTNTYTGATTIHHGALEVQSSGALGTSAGSTFVMSDAGLWLSGGVTLADSVIISGTGINNTGAIRNLSGNNTISGNVILNTAANSGLVNRISSDAGTLTFNGNINGNNIALHIGGSGDIVTNGALSTNLGATIKDGTGTLYTNGVNNQQTGFVLNGGGIRVSSVGGLANTSGIFTLTDGRLEIINLTPSTPAAHNIARFSWNGGHGTLVLTPGTSTVTLSMGVFSGRVIGTTLDYSTAAGATLNTVSRDTNGIFNAGFTVDKTSWATSAATQSTSVSWVNSTDTISIGGLANDSQVVFATAPGGLTAGTIYYVRNSTGSNFQVSASPGGSVIALTSDGSTATMNQSGAITGLASGSYSSSFAANANVDLAAGTTTQGTATVNTLRFNNAGSATLAMSGTLTLNNPGGILITSNVGANDITLRSSSGTAQSLSVAELVIHQHNTAGRLIIGDATNPLNLTSTVATITKTGAGEVVLRGTASNALAGGMNVYVQEGTFTVDGSERFTGANNVNFTIGSSTTTAKVVFGNGASTGTETINSITPGALSGSSLVGGGSALYTLTLNRSTTQDWTNLTVGGPGANENNLALTFTNTGTTILGATNTYTGATTISGGTVQLGNGGTTGSIANTSGIALTSATATLRTTRSDSLTLSQDITGSGKFEHTGTGTTILTGTSTYGGSTTVSNGTLQLGNGGTTGSIASSSGISLSSASATLKTSRSDSITLGQAITGTGNVEIANTATGTTVLTSASNIYSGTTTVSGGSLQVGNAGVGKSGTGATTVTSGSTILGSGVVQGSSVTFVSLSTIRPGDSAADSSHGTLTFTPASTGTYDIQSGASVILGVTTPTLTDATFGGNVLGSAGYNTWLDGIGGVGSHDRLVFNGDASSTLAFSGNLSVIGSSYSAQLGDVFNLMDWAAVLGTNFSGFSSGTNYRDGSTDNGSQFDLPDISGSGFLWDISRFTSSGNISVIVVPEPSRALLLCLGLAGLVLRRRKGVPQPAARNP